MLMMSFGEKDEGKDKEEEEVEEEEEEEEKKSELNGDSERKDFRGTV